jgi:hypothetical protein
MGRNGKQHPARPRIEIRQAAASAEEAAAIAAAIEQFLADCSPRPKSPERPVSPWLRAAMLENAGIDPAGAEPWVGLSGR